MPALSFSPHSYEAIVQPQRIFPINAYFLDHWLPYLTPAHAWLIIALRQRAYHNKQQPWCEVAHLHLAAETGLSLSTVKNFFKAPSLRGLSPAASPVLPTAPIWLILAAAPTVTPWPRLSHSPPCTWPACGSNCSRSSRPR